MTSFEPKEEVLTLKTPRLDAEEKLYVKAYFSSLNHITAHSILRPLSKKHSKNNLFSKRDSVQFHIKKGMIDKLSSLDLSEEKIMDLLLQEATRLGNGSSPTARVQALTLLGKQIGMFEEKKDTKEAVTFNIINYSKDEKVKSEEVLKVKEVVSKQIPNLEIKSYKEV